MSGVDFESLDDGTPLQGLATPALTRVTLARFAGAVDDYNPLHLDDKVATAAGKASVFAPATLVMSYVGRMVEAWVGGGALRTFGLRMTKPVWPGDVLTCRGSVRDKTEQDGEYIVGVDVRADNQRGEMVATGRFIAAVPKRAGDTLSRKSGLTGIVYPVGDAGASAKKSTTSKKPARKK